MKSMQEIYKWLICIIDTVNNDYHFEGVDNLIELFAKRFPGNENLIICLKQARQDKWNDIHHILN